MRAKVYKSPVYATIWSFACPGFGQVYTGQYVLGFLLVVLEFIVNFQSHLNLSLYYTFHGEFHHAIHAARFEWGLFYPSLLGFSMWQAYDRAREINHLLDEKKEPFKSNLPGLFFGLVAGMNLGLILYVPEIFGHHYFSPSINGICGGLIGMGVGGFLEKKFS